MRILIILACLLATVFAAGQSNMIKAVAIDNNGDSIYGNIDYRNWKNNPQTINFINSANEKKTFDPSSIRGFIVPRVMEVYTSFMVEIDNITSDQDRAIQNNFIDTVLVKKKVFLFQLVKHRGLSLYEYNSEHKDRFYYKKENEEPVELIHHYLFDESSNRVREITTYQDQLFFLFSGCPDAANKSTRIKFTKKEIQETFVQYLKCLDPASVIDARAKDEGSFKIGIIGGLMWNTFKFKGTASFADDNYSSSLSPLLGVSFDLGLSRNRNKWHFINEVMYKSYKTGTSFTRPYGTGYTVTSDVDLNFSFVQLNTLARYILQSGGICKPFINFGIANAFMVSENTNKTHLKYSFAQEEDITAIDRPRKYEFSLLGGAGITMQKIAFEFRYEGNKKGFSPVLSLDTNPASFQFIVTYRL